MFAAHVCLSVCVLHLMGFCGAPVDKTVSVHTYVLFFKGTVILSLVTLTRMLILLISLVTLHLWFNYLYFDKIYGKPMETELP